jgi:hypothetical protein
MALGAPEDVDMVESEDLLGDFPKGFKFTVKKEPLTTLLPEPCGRKRLWDSRSLMLLYKQCASLNYPTEHLLLLWSFPLSLAIPLISSLWINNKQDVYWGLANQVISS